MTTSPRLVRSLCLLLGLSLASAADVTVDSPVTATGAGTTATADDAGTAAQLLQKLPQVPELAIDGAKVVWKANGASATVVGYDDDSQDPLLDTVLGPMKVAHELVEGHRTAVLAVLSTLGDKAKAAGLAAKDLTIGDGALTGPRLSGTGVLVVPGGVLKLQPKPDHDRKAEIAALSAAVKALLAQDAATKLDDIARHSLDDVVLKLEHPDGNEPVDEIAPSFARRQVRHGWLRRWYRAAPAAAAEMAVENGVATVAKMAPVLAYAGDGMRLEQMQDAFGSGGWVFTTPQKVLYIKDEARPEMLGEDTGLKVIVELPPGADPANGAAQAVAARSLHDDQVVATWSASRGFQADASAWTDAVQPRGRDLLPDAIPPHIVLSGLNGDVAALAVPNGLLRPAKDTPLGKDSQAESDRFLTDAAHLLTGPAQLDLVGEYLFSYVYPSPDSSHPELMGNKQLKSNVQQTVWQTCGNAAGGTMHGDCADIAELYQTITLRQGIDPVVIGLPEHAACAWAIKKNDGWDVDILQTGPPLTFHDTELPTTLEKAFKSFDPGMPFDANQLPLLLRFSGEVSRSEWALSWRIFKDRDYFKVMTDVQRDWHYETYQRGIATMKGLIAAGDDDNANYRELSGLYNFTGQYDLCAEYHEKAMARTDDPVSKLYMTVELVQHLLDAKKPDEAKAAADDVLDKQMPALADKIGASGLQVGLNLVAVCLASGGGPGLSHTADRAMNQLHKPLSDLTERLATWVEKRFDQNNWDNSPELRSIKGLIAGYCGTITAMIAQRVKAHKDPDDLSKALTASEERWLSTIAFRDVETDASVLEKYAAAAQWYQALLGEDAFDKLLEAATPPTAAIPLAEHANRVSGDAQMQKDLPWIRISVPYWYGRLAELFGKDNATIDAAKVAHICARLAEARTESAAIGLADPIFEGQALLGVEIGALIAKDDKALRAALTLVASRNDKAFRDDAAQWLGDAARFIPPADYAKVLKAWQDTNDYKPKYFWIAWRAALNQAPEQALMAAKLAAERFKDDPAFAEEYGFMKQVLATQAAAAKAATAAATAPATSAAAAPGQ